MLSNLLGLTIDKGDLNKKSPSPIINSTKKAAINYLAIGKMAEELKLIRSNFSEWLALEGVRVRDKPDMHMLKEDELTRKFGVMREKYFKSKVKLESRDGKSGLKGWAKHLLEMYVERKIERNLAARVLKRYKKLTTIRKLVKLHNKFKKAVNKILSKLNLKKMLVRWIKANYKKFITPLVNSLKNAFKRFVKKGLTKLATRFGISFLASQWATPIGAAIIAAVVTIGLMVWDPLMAAIDEFKKPGGSPFEVFFVKLIDEFTLGFFEEADIKDFLYWIVDWHEKMFMKMFDAIDKSFKFIEEKMTSFVDFVIKKGKELFTTETRPADFESSFEKSNKQRIKEESEMFEKYTDYFQKMEEAISAKKLKIRQLEVEIASLEYDISSMVKGPENARLEEAKVEKAKEEAEKARLEEETKKTREGGSAPAAKEKEKPVAKSPVPESKPAVKKPEPAPPAPSTTPTSTGGNNGKLEQALLDEIAKHESASSGDYNAMNQGTKGKLIGGPSIKIIGKNLTDMTVGEIINKAATDKDSAEKRKKEGLIFAAGRYQIIPKTLKELVKKGVASLKDKFNAETQDKLGIALLELRGLSKFKQGKIKADEFQNNLAKEWASLPTSSGLSYYHKPGQNVAGKGADQGLKNAIASYTPSTGTQLASTEKSTTTAAGGKFLDDKSKQVAQGQREEMKPKDVNVADARNTNNVKKTNYQNVAMGKDTNPAETVVARAA